MSAPRPGLPRSAWLAAGVAAAAGGVAVGVPAAVALVAGLVTIAAGRSGGARLAGPRSAAMTAAGVGAVLLGLRVLAGPAPAPPPALPGVVSGPWQATVESMSSSRDGSQVARLRLHTAAGEVLVAATLPAFPVVAAGAEVEVDGRLRPPPDDDPYGEYLRRTGASGSLQASAVRILAPPDGGSLQAQRDGAGDALRLALPEPEAGLAAGILIGLRERVDRDLAADFATAGASHVVAISGWNIAIVAGLVGAVLRGRPRRLVAVVVGGTIAAYVVAAGASPSVVRAAVMAAVVLAARESGRAGRAAAALGLAAAILLLFDPAMIEDAGFRLSVMATAGLLAWASPIGAWIGRLGGGRVPGWLAESLGISLAAQAATLPDVLATFGRLSLVSPAVNLAVVPLVPVAMAGGVVAMLAGWLVMLGAPPPIGVIAGLPGWLVLHVIVALVRLAAGLPFAAVALPPGVAAPAGAVAALAILAAPTILRRIRARRSRRRRPAAGATPASGGGRRHGPGPTAAQRGIVVAAALVVGIASLALGDAATRTTRIVMLDVGQGDAILLESRSGARILVDGGPDPDRLLLQLDARIPPWDRRVDVLVLTHPHEDHVAGLVRVLDRYRVGRVYESGMHGAGPGWAAWDSALRDGMPRGTLAAGARIRLDEILLTVLWPDPGTVPVEPADTGRGINGASVILLGEAAGRRFLLAGDAEDDVDPVLAARGLPRLDVLKVAHHGSATATSAGLLAATRPAVALISVGEGNDYGHPASSTLARLRDAGARVYRTDRDGTVEVTRRFDGVGVRT
ncbi:MAG: ComEC/Rec2 family competence protein, partial [Candidatus Limnocylindrales bacterium]